MSYSYKPSSILEEPHLKYFIQQYDKTNGESEKGRGSSKLNEDISRGELPKTELTFGRSFLDNREEEFETNDYEDTRTILSIADRSDKPTREYRDTIKSKDKHKERNPHQDPKIIEKY